MHRAAALAVILAAARSSHAQPEVEGKVIWGGGECTPGPLPPACSHGELVEVDWRAFLGSLCRGDERRADPLLTDYSLHALSCFNQSTAEGCPHGFFMTLLSIFRSGSPEWLDQVVRFRPDGSFTVLVASFTSLHGKEFAQFHFDVPVVAQGELPPPFPGWTIPGPLSIYQRFQDLTQVPARPPTERCSAEALPGIGCSGGVWSQLLALLCRSCGTAPGAVGFPCRYSEELWALIGKVVMAGSDREAPVACAHGLLAAALAWYGRAGVTPPEVSPTVYRMWRGEEAAHVLHVCFRQLAGDPANFFMLNVPMIDLSPFPFHTGILRSARAGGEDPRYHMSVVAFISAALTRMGVPHVVMPGDGSVSMWSERQTRRGGGLSSIFIDKRFAADVDVMTWDVLERLPRQFGGMWRAVQVAPGLWQLGEEPYRFSPRAGVHFRALCKECVAVSLHLFVRDDPGGDILPLTQWTPCRIPHRRVFPVAHKEREGEVLPMAADWEWLRLEQRPPMRWIGPGPSCAEARRRQAAAAPAPLADGFDISEAVHHELGLFDLMRLREDSENPGLRRYSDKIQFKSRLLREGVPVPRIYHMSDRSPDVRSVLRSLGTDSYVAKPTHLAATSFVYVMRDGVNVVSGRRTSLDEVADGLAAAWSDRHVDDWATESTPPGVIVEELVEAPGRETGTRTPDEFKCYTFFGELFFCEWVYVQNMTTGSEGVEFFLDANIGGDRALPSEGHRTCGIPNFANNGYVFKDMSCLDCRHALPLSAEAWAKLVRIVESVAAGTDHIRIDVFVTVDGEPLVNEANISFLKASGFPAVLREEMRRRWLDGYRAATT